MWAERTSVLLLVCSILIPVRVGRAQATPVQSPRGPTVSRQSTPRWVRVAPASEEFEAVLPAAPEEAVERLQVGGKTVVVRYYGVSADETRYAVLSADVKDFPGEELAYVMMLNLCNKQVASSSPDKGEVSGAAVQAEFRRALWLNGYAGREYKIRVRTSTGLLRFYNTGRKYYAAVAVTTGDNTPLINRFMDSFTLAAPAPAGSRRAPAGSPESAKRQGTPPVPVTSGTWLVILKTYAMSERAAANHALDLFRRAGYEASVVRTEDYPNLRKGLLAIVMGPYPKAVAQEVRTKARSAAKGAYIKSGW